MKKIKIILFMLLLVPFLIFSQEDLGDDGTKQDKFYFDALLSMTVDDFDSTFEDVVLTFIEKPKLRIIKEPDSFYVTRIVLSGLIMYNYEKTITKITYVVSPPNKIFTVNFIVGNKVKQLSSYYELLSVMKTKYQMDHDLF